MSRNEGKYNRVYQAAAAENVVVKNKPGYLKGIIIGADVGSAVIEVSNHASDGDGNVEIYVAGSTLMTTLHGYIPVNSYFKTGICVDQTLQTHCTYIYS